MTMRPNVLVIVADDLAYADIGPFGESRISTPNLNALSEDGLRMTNFHVQPTCSPTRATLMTGADNHLVGLGSMREHRTKVMEHVPGYEGHLNDRAPTIAQLLKDRGYRTFMAGKWHLGATPASNPAAQGFDKSFALMGGGGSHWDNLGLLKARYQFSTFLEDGKEVDRPDGYSSDLYTDRLLGWMRQAVEEGKPFFAYLAFQATHDPLHAPDKFIERYKGRFDDGYDRERLHRFERMKQAGVIPASTRLSPKTPLYEDWDGLSPGQKKYQARLMEIFAGMVDSMDHNIGRIIDYLKESGQYDRTLIAFFSDNGPTPAYMDFYPGNADGTWIRETFDNRFENLGAPKSFVGLGPAWADVGATPFRLFKFFQTEGGTLSPLILKVPGMARPGMLSDSFAAIEDLHATLLEATGTDRPDTHRGRPVAPLKGASMLAFLAGRTDSVHPADYEHAQELFGSMYYRKGDWKLSWMPQPFGSGEWQLYDTREDRGETTDLAARHPELVKELSDKYRSWAAAHGVVDWDYDFLYQDVLSYFDWRKGKKISPSADQPSPK